MKDLIETKLQCDFFSSEADYDGNTLKGIKKTLAKGDAVKELRKKYSKIIAIGDSMNDCSMFEAADMRISYGGVHQPTATLIKLSNYVVFEAKSLVNLLELNIEK